MSSKDHLRTSEFSASETTLESSGPRSDTLMSGVSFDAHSRGIVLLPITAKDMTTTSHLLKAHVSEDPTKDSRSGILRHTVLFALSARWSTDQAGNELRQTESRSKVDFVHVC
jgi:hypothetical protein